MISQIKAEWKKLMFMNFTKIYLLILMISSLLLGITFSLTTNMTQGRALNELPNIDVITANLLGIDVGAIMLLVFTAIIISSEFSTKFIHVVLAVTPQRGKVFFAKLAAFGIFSTCVSLIITSLTFSCGQFILYINGRDMVSLADGNIIRLLAGCMAMPIFYCLITVCFTFLFRNSALSITCSLGIMILPAFISWFDEKIQMVLLPLLPRAALHSLSGISELGTESISIIRSTISLLIWLSTLYMFALWNFKRKDII
ncbi:ABC-2 family transporter [Mobilisporobacter senegalensis]|uniref:ABC-2 family transporter n=1 Tax=Mobilisporobacter senegalensis TaxID=1329262 RepID=A0A3N1XQ70_9FIRM|nr:ABC transporter permease [Mobilisporobacter senegalensis]ROR27242.1 ABC-2 family transporter [Mobilisporobacter senegalensis]